MAQRRRPHWPLRLIAEGPGALPRVADDLHVALRLALEQGGVIEGNGVSAGRAAELVVVCEVVAAAPPEPVPPPSEPRMVFSAPEGVAALRPDERLDNLVLDVIRCSTAELVVGGPFWNQAGFDRLDEVLLPALTRRRVNTTVVLHAPDSEHRGDLEAWLGRLHAAGPTTVEWYAPTAYSMMHAKFVVADRRGGTSVLRTSRHGDSGPTSKPDSSFFPDSAADFLPSSIPCDGVVTSATLRPARRPPTSGRPAIHAAWLVSPYADRPT